MTVNRREFLKSAGAALGGALLLEGTPQTAFAATTSEVGSDSVSMLYDNNICVGCKACQYACKNREDRPLAAETDSTGLFEEPYDLSASTWTLIKLYQSPDSSETAFVKAQCVHCNEPACVSVCPVAALEKLPSGPVIYHTDRCIGCRYCMAACPYGIPRYQWTKTWPLIQKCDFCANRLSAGKNPACTDACPTGALIFGKRKELLSQAKDRIQANPDKYVNHVYGENEAGGTAVLYLSKVSFDKIGLPDLKPRSIPSMTWPYLMAVPGIVVVVGGLMSAIYSATRRREKAQEG